MLVKQYIKSDFGKRLYQLFQDKNYKEITSLLSEYMYYDFKLDEKRDITNILIKYLNYGKIKGKNQFIHLVLQFLVSNKTFKALTELYAFLSIYFVKNKKKARFNSSHIKLISEAVVQMISVNLHQFGEKYFTEEKRTIVNNTMLTLIEALITKPENKLYKKFLQFWIKWLKSFNANFSKKNESKKEIIL